MKLRGSLASEMSKMCDKPDMPEHKDDKKDEEKDKEKDKQEEAMMKEMHKATLSIDVKTNAMMAHMQHMKEHMKSMQDKPKYTFQIVRDNDGLIKSVVAIPASIMGEA